MHKTLFIRMAALMLGLFIFANPSHSQRPLEIDEIKVIAPYEPSISDAYKININPVIEDTITVDRNFDYSIRPLKILTRFTPETISPARMRGEPLTKLYRGLVKGGMGNYQTPYFEGFYNTLRSNEYALGLHVRHLSSNNDIKDLENSVFSKNKAHVYGTRFFRNTALDASVLFNRHVVHYYGIPVAGSGTLKTIETVEKSDPGNSWITGEKQHFNLLSSNLAFGTHHGDSSKLNYRFGLEHHWLTDRYYAREHHFNGNAMFGKEISEDPFGLAQKQYFRIDLSADYFHNTTPGETNHDSINNTGVYSVKPAIYSYYDKLNFHIGVNVSVEDNNASYELRAWPVVGFEASLVPGRLIFYMGLSGGLEKQNLRNLSAINPFMNSSANLEFSNTRSEIWGGFKGSFGDRLSYNISLINSKIDNQAFFINWYAPAASFPFFDNRFDVVYDDMNRLNIRGQITSRFGERFTLRLQADYFDYDLETGSKAWHMPGFTASLNARYNIQNKIILSANLFGRGETYGVDFTETPLTTGYRKLHDFYIDANLGIEYRYTKRLGMFLNFYNMQNESYERWTFYPTQGLHFMGGLSYAF